MNKQYTFISLFAGGGGLDLGFMDQGFKCTLANDIELYSRDTFKHNWPTTPFICDDIRKISAINAKLKGYGYETRMVFVNKMDPSNEKSKVNKLAQSYANFL